MPPTLLDRLQNIDWLVLDVDGVLTDGGIYYDNAGVESKRFHVRDGSAWLTINRPDQRNALDGPVIEGLLEELGISPVIQGAAEKLPAYRKFLAETGCPPERVCAIGDDVPDLGVLRHSGLAVTVADACPEARAAAHFVTRASGGAGAVREAIECILKAQGKWQPIVDRFWNEPL